MTLEVPRPVLAVLALPAAPLAIGPPLPLPILGARGWGWGSVAHAVGQVLLQLGGYGKVLATPDADAAPGGKAVTLSFQSS